MKEHITKPSYEMLIAPENSDFGMRWNHGDHSFAITSKDGSTELCTLPYSEGKYIYAVLRGQQRIEEAGKLPDHDVLRTMTKDRFMKDMTAIGIQFPEAQMQKAWRDLLRTTSVRTIPAGKHPSLTHRFLYKGMQMEPKQPFVWTEDKRKRTGMDVTPRIANRDEDCHVAARTWARMSGFTIVETGFFLKTCPTYENLAQHVAAYGIPALLEIVSTDPLLFHGVPHYTHSCIVLRSLAQGELLCFEKVGNALPWRLTTLRDTYTMYEHDFKQANAGRPKIQWNIQRLTPQTEG